MPEKRWKKEERRVARLLNARRNPHGDPQAADVENNFLVGEVKDRKELPAWIVAALARARATAGANRVGLVVITSPSTPEILIVLNGYDFREWFIGTPRKERR